MLECAGPVRAGAAASATSFTLPLTICLVCFQHSPKKLRRASCPNQLLSSVRTTSHCQDKARASKNENNDTLLGLTPKTANRQDSTQFDAPVEPGFVFSKTPNRQNSTQFDAPHRLASFFQKRQIDKTRHNSTLPTDWLRFFKNGKSTKLDTIRRSPPTLASFFQSVINYEISAANCGACSLANATSRERSDFPIRTRSI